MPLDNYLEQYDYVESHSREVPGPRDQTLYNLVRHLDFSSSLLIRALFLLRGLGTRTLNMDTMLSGDEFTVLEETPEREIVIGGMAGAGMKPVPVQSETHFKEFQEKNGIKIAWNFHLGEHQAGNTMVTTETRVQCLGPKVKRLFSVYWFFIRPFSGLVRLEMLRILRNQVAAARLI